MVEIQSLQNYSGPILGLQSEESTAAPGPGLSAFEICSTACIVRSVNNGEPSWLVISTCSTSKWWMPNKSVWMMSNGFTNLLSGKNSLESWQSNRAGRCECPTSLEDTAELFSRGFSYLSYLSFGPSGVPKPYSSLRVRLCSAHFFLFFRAFFEG